MTGTAKHTPDPWRVETGTTLIWGACDRADTTSYGMGYPIAEARITPSNPRWARGPNSDEGEANARLIAAAPDMLAEIDKQIEWLLHLRAEIGDSIRPSLRMGIDQSIKYLGLVSAKARGETAP